MGSHCGHSGCSPGRRCRLCGEFWWGRWQLCCRVRSCSLRRSAWWQAVQHGLRHCCCCVVLSLLLQLHEHSHRIQAMDGCACSACTLSAHAQHAQHNSVPCSQHHVLTSSGSSNHVHLRTNGPRQQASALPARHAADEAPQVSCTASVASTCNAMSQCDRAGSQTPADRTSFLNARDLQEPVQGIIWVTWCAEPPVKAVTLCLPDITSSLDDVLQKSKFVLTTRTEPHHVIQLTIHAVLNTVNKPQL